MSIRARYRLERGEFVLDVDLDMAGQGITAVFGPSGSGKTTLLRLIAGLDRAPGHLEVNGEIWQDDAARRFLPTHRRALGYVFQEASLFPHLSARRNLEYGMQRVPADARRVAMQRVLDLLGIGHLLERMPENLSGGERQRVAIGRALLTSPRVLLMDEPLSALDLARKQEILPYLERLHDELEIPILYVSHAADEVARLADHIVVLDSGRAVAEGPLAETLARLDLPIRLGDDAGVVLDARIGERDATWHLVRADFAGGALWVRDTGLPTGHRVRIRILARDVSVALDHPDRTSIVNLLPGTVEAIADESHPALALVRANVGGQAIVARVTRRSAATLGLAPGMPVWLQIKAVALIG